jgi:soluble lytic murein transglycosylase-like protein
MEALSSYEQLRAGVRATRVESAEQVRALHPELAGRAVELSGRVVGVMNGRGGKSILLRCAPLEGESSTVALPIPTLAALDADTVRALRAGAEVRILARVNTADADPILQVLAATTDPALASLFRDDEPENEVLTPVNGALPLPGITTRAAFNNAAPRSESKPEPKVATSGLPPVRLKSAPKTGPRKIAPLSPSFLASAQARAPRRPAARARAVPRVAPRASDEPRVLDGNSGEEPMLFADDSRIESQVPAYKKLVKRFNKKLSDAQADEIARALLTAGYRQNMDPRFLAAIIAVESDFDIYCLSSSGAMGLGQIMPFNLPEVGMKKGDAWNPTKNVHGTAALLRGHLNKYKDRPNGTLLAVAAYNAGDGAVRRAGYRVPPGNSPKQRQTQRYVWKVYYRYKEFAPELFR